MKRFEFLQQKLQRLAMKGAEDCDFEGLPEEHDELRLLVLPVEGVEFRKATLQEIGLALVVLASLWYYKSLKGDGNVVLRMPGG